jgi:hypothetical protein
VRLTSFPISIGIGYGQADLCGVEQKWRDPKRSRVRRLECLAQREPDDCADVSTLMLPEALMLQVASIGFEPNKPVHGVKDAPSLIRHSRWTLFHAVYFSIRVAAQAS